MERPVHEEIGRCDRKAFWLSVSRARRGGRRRRLRRRITLIFVDSLDPGPARTRCAAAPKPASLPAPLSEARPPSASRRASTRRACARRVIHTPRERRRRLAGQHGHLQKCLMGIQAQPHDVFVHDWLLRMWLCRLGANPRFLVPYEHQGGRSHRAPQTSRQEPVVPSCLRPSRFRRFDLRRSGFTRSARFARRRLSARRTEGVVSRPKRAAIVAAGGHQYPVA